MEKITKAFEVFRIAHPIIRSLYGDTTENIFYIQLNRRIWYRRINNLAWEIVSKDIPKSEKRIRKNIMNVDRSDLVGTLFCPRQENQIIRERAWASRRRSIEL